MVGTKKNSRKDTRNDASASLSPRNGIEFGKMCEKRKKKKGVRDKKHLPAC